MSTPTTAKYESGDSTRSVFSWTFPGAPIRVNMPLDLISRLRSELDQHEYLANDAEVGGVLLGRPKTPTTLEIDDYVWVSSAQQPDHQYRLDPAQLERLRSLYTFAVGYFRTQSEADLRLRDEEISFFAKHFPEPTDVVLVIQTSPQQHTAGFFFWMQKGVIAPVSFMEFPLDAELLRVEPTPPPPATTSTDAATPVESVSPVGETPISDPVADVGIGLWLRSRLERLWARYSIWIAAEGQVQQTEEAEYTPERIPRRMLVAVGVAFAVLAITGLSAFLLQDHGLSAQRQKAAAIAAFPLQLSVEALGNGLNIRWNPQNAPVTQAREGRLLILEGDRRPRSVPLNPQQLASGHIYYRSSAERLQFQLEIVDRSGTVSKESVLVLSSKP